jgi:hypothetical protein
MTLSYELGKLDALRLLYQRHSAIFERPVFEGYEPLKERCDWSAPIENVACTTFTKQYMRAPEYIQELESMLSESVVFGTHKCSSSH